MIEEVYRAYMNKLFLGQLDPIGFDNKLVLVRTDYNIPLITTSDGKVSVGNDARIRASLSSLHFLVNANARVVVCSHLGRPTHDGTSDATFSLFPVAERLQSLLADIPVTFVDDCIGPKVEILKEKLPPRSILLLENLRFHPEEENNDDMFAETLCAQVEIYVNEAFAASHRGNPFLLH